MNTTAMSVNAGVVMELTGRRIDKVNRELQLPHIGHTWPMRLVMSVLDVWFVRRIGQLTSQLMDDAIWFKGVDKELWDANEDVRGSSQRLLQSLQRTQETLMVARKKALDLAQHEFASPALQQATSGAVAACVDLFDSIESFRWTLMELEANHSPRSEGYFASTPDALDDLFAKIDLEDVN